MKKSFGLIFSVMVLLLVTLMPGFADGPRGGGGGYRGGGGGYYGGGYHRGGWGGAAYHGGAWAGHRYGGGVWVGPGWGGWGYWGPGWGAWGIPLYPYPYYQAPQVIIQEQPPVYIPQESATGGTGILVLLQGFTDLLSVRERVPNRLDEGCSCTLITEPEGVSHEKKDRRTRDGSGSACGGRMRLHPHGAKRDGIAGSRQDL